MSYQIKFTMEIDDLLDGLDISQTICLLRTLKERGMIPEECEIDKDGSIKLPKAYTNRVLQENADEFNQALSKLYNNGWRLTKEEEQSIYEVAKRF
jgi:hypothetical protein